MGRPRDLFAIIELEFGLEDIRFLSLSAGAQLVYLKMWLLCMKERHEWLSNYRGVLVRRLASICNLPENDTRNILREITEYSPFLTVKGDWYKVNGVKRKHHGYTWFSQDIPEISPEFSPNIPETTLNDYDSITVHSSQKDRKNTDPLCGSDSLKEEKKKISARSDSKQSSEPTTVPDDLKGLFLYESDAKLCARYPELIKSWKVSFPGLDVLQIIKEAHAWEVANPTKRKKNRPVFLNAWLARENDRPRKTQSGGSSSNLEMVGWE